MPRKINKSNVTKPTKFSCVCGHSEELHSYWDNYRLWDKPVGRCEVWLNIDEGLLGTKCACQNYKQDNLKFVEDCSVKAKTRKKL